MTFPSTHWSDLARATEGASTESRKALEALCGRYWGPIHEFIRSRRVPDPDAQDLTQDFMVHVLQKSVFHRGDPLRGRFRSFMLGALVRFLRDAEDKRTALKRGGRAPHLSLDTADSGRAGEISCPPQEAEVFDREWALTILESALERLRAQYAEAGSAEPFATLKQFLPGAAAVPSYVEAAQGAGLSVSALKSEVHRLRRRLRDLVRAEVAQTVSAPHEVESEFTYLQQVLRARNCELARDLKPAGVDS